MEKEPLGHEYEVELEAKLGAAIRGRLPMAGKFEGDDNGLNLSDSATAAHAIGLLVNWVARLAYEVDRLSNEVEQLRRGGP